MKMDFIENIKDRVRGKEKIIVLPETNDERVLQATKKIAKEKFARIILLGDSSIESKFIDSNIEIINPKTSPLLEKYIDMFVKLRHKKGMTKDIAKDLLLNNPLYFGVALVEDNVAHGMVAGSISPTSNVLKPALQIIGKSEDVSVVSSFVLMIIPDSNLGFRYGNSGIFGFSDCGLIQEPTDYELAQIAISSAKTFEQLTQSSPKVALLSHSTHGSAKHPKIEKIHRALSIIKNKNLNLQIDGELQLDAAIIESVGKLKAPKSAIAGEANTLIFPDIDSGNIGYKLLQRLGKARAYGPITQGIRKPINDLSRGCDVDDIVGVVAITASQALD